LKSEKWKLNKNNMNIERRKSEMVDKWEWL
jgi:hypothetical protein